MTVEVTVKPKKEPKKEVKAKAPPKEKKAKVEPSGAGQLATIADAPAPAPPPREPTPPPPATEPTPQPALPPRGANPFEPEASPGKAATGKLRKGKTVEASSKPDDPAFSVGDGELARVGGKGGKGRAKSGELRGAMDAANSGGDSGPLELAPVRAAQSYQGASTATAKPKGSKGDAKSDAKGKSKSQPSLDMVQGGLQGVGAPAPPKALVEQTPARVAEPLAIQEHLVPPKPERDAWLDPTEAESEGMLPGWRPSTPHTPEEHRGRPLPPGVVRMTANLNAPAPSTSAAPASSKDASAPRQMPHGNDAKRAANANSGVAPPLPITQLVLTAGVSVSTGTAPLPMSQLPNLIAANLQRAGYVDVQARIIGDNLRVSAHSPPQDIEAGLVQVSAGADGADAVESVIDEATNSVKPNTTLVFSSGDSVPLGRQPLTLDALPLKVEQQLAERGYVGVATQIDEVSGIVHVRGRRRSEMIASLESISSAPPLVRGGEPTVLPGNISPRSSLLP